ncbi:MAG: glucose-6-phosphate dehydrogenase [Deltaproteobacteria bacterium]|nr:glucose-6-phosphate dehydrogenase [Deltaproteobacteria bacterium]
MSTSGERHNGTKCAGPCTMVIFGASGDLTKRKLVPALYNLVRQKLLPEEFSVIGFARRETAAHEFREQMRRNIHEYAGDDFDPEPWRWLESRLDYIAGAFDDDAAYARLAAQLAQSAATTGSSNVLFYLAAAPEQFGPIVEKLSRAELTGPSATGWRRVVVEKPFGRDLESARSLNVQLRGFLAENQIYRIDHYLGKETVQNLLVFRFANGIFEPIWNRRYVDHVQITVAEALGVEGRGGYYEEAGALRDMVPNHIFQLISLVAMEPPISFDADAVRDEQSKVLRAIQPMRPEDVLTKAVRGQYAMGTIRGRRLPDYRQEDRVDSLSNTETFVAMKVEIDNWRWKDVPFYLRVGKAMPRRLTEIAVQFRRPPFALFRGTEVGALQSNQLVISVAPDEGISLSFSAKIPGATMRIGSVDMDFDYTEHFGTKPATGYERLLHDAFLGDQTLYQRADMVEAGWTVVAPVLDVWTALTARDFPNYAAGTWGPDLATELLARDGRNWRVSDR